MCVCVGEFLLTSSTDRTVSLWSTSGAFVGQFGACVWLLDTPTTWRATTAYDLDAKDTFNLSMSKEVPKRSSLIKAMSSRMSVMGIASPPMQAHASPCTVVDARGDMARAPHATASAGGAIGGSQSRPSTAMHGAAMQRDASPLSRPVSSNSRASPKPRQSMVSFSGAKAQAVNDLRMSKLSIPVGAIGSGGDGGGAHDSPQPSPSRMGRTVSLVAGAAVDACASPRAVSAGGCRVLSTQSPEPEPSHGPVSPRPAGELSHATSSRFGVTGEARATTAPDDIARVLVASHQNRLRHVKSLRLHERYEPCRGFVSHVMLSPGVLKHTLAQTPCRHASMRPCSSRHSSSPRSKHMNRAQDGGVAAHMCVCVMCAGLKDHTQARPAKPAAPASHSSHPHDTIHAHANQPQHNNVTHQTRPCHGSPTIPPASPMTSSAPLKMTIQPRTTNRVVTVVMVVKVKIAVVKIYLANLRFLRLTRVTMISRARCIWTSSNWRGGRCQGPVKGVVGWGRMG